MEREKFTTVLCFGDSNTYGYDPYDGLRYSENVRWTGILRKKLGEDYRVIEEGCNGRTAASIPADEPWKYGPDYLPACLNTHKPVDIIVLMLGSNDLKKQFHAAPEDISGGIHKILETIADFTFEKQGFVPRVILMSPPYIGEGIEESPFSKSFDYDAVARSGKLAPLYKAEAEFFSSLGSMGGSTGSTGSTGNTNSFSCGSTGSTNSFSCGSTESAIKCDFIDIAQCAEPSEADSLHLTPEGHAAIAEAVYERITDM